MKQIKILVTVISIIVMMFTFSLCTLAVSYRETIRIKLEYCASLSSDLYQPKTWDNFQKAIVSVSPYVDASYGTDEEASRKLIELNNAIVGLRRLANLDALKATVENLGYLNEKDFKQESWNSLLKVIAIVKGALADSNSSQVTINKMQNDLAIAQSRLIKMDGTTCSPIDNASNQTNKDVLNSSVYNVGYLDKNMFTETSWEIFMITYNIAKDVLNNPKATEFSITQIQSDLVIAESNLEMDANYGYLKSKEFLEFPEHLRIINRISEESSSNIVSSDTDNSSNGNGKKKNVSKSVSSSQVYDVGSTIILIVIVLFITALGFVAVVFGRKFLVKRRDSNDNE